MSMTTNNYIYTLTSTGNGSELILYTWEGEYVCNSVIYDVKLVPCGLVENDGAFYVFYDTEDGGGVLYKTVFEKQN